MKPQGAAIKRIEIYEYIAVRLADAEKF